MRNKKLIKVILLLLLGILIVGGTLYLGHLVQERCNEEQKVEEGIKF